MNQNYTQQPTQQRFFQKQGLLSNLCAMHVVNNYLGYGKYTKEMMNNVCYDLSQDCINPHKSIFGGNYDVNVLLVIFQLEQIRFQYHDMRKEIKITEEECGFIVNYSVSECCLIKCFDFGRHWIVFKRQGQGFVQYDSIKSGPIYHKSSSLQRILRGFNSSHSTILKMFPSNPTQTLGLANGKP